jgi:3-methyladenine DNA glycosylase/8-oxoguanine DNA glycosylase
LGTDLDLKPLYQQAKNDLLLQNMFSEIYGLKRISRGSFFEDAINRIIIAQISHKPTAKKMVYGVRQAYGTRLEDKSGVVCTWPKPEKLIGVEASSLKKHGLSLRKGEYVTGLAHEIVSGELNQPELEGMAPVQFYNRLLQIRGIGPTTAQDLMLYRNRTDAVFPSRIEKEEEKGLRRWILLSYNADPDKTSEEDFKHLIRCWKGYESLALEHLYVDWIISEKKKKTQRQNN